MTGLVPATAIMDMPMIVGSRNVNEVQAALDWASAAVESYCERSFAQVVGDTITIDPYYGSLTNKGGYGADSSYSYGGYPVFGSAGMSGMASYGGRAMLWNPPVTNVTQVQALMPQPGDSDNDMTWITLQYYNWTETGLLYDASMLPGNIDGPQPSWPTLPGSLRVTYDHGFVLPGDTGTGPALPEAITNAIIRAAATYLANPWGFTAWRTGDVSYDATGYNHTSGPAGAVLDEVTLGRYRLVGL